MTLLILIAFLAQPDTTIDVSAYDMSPVVVVNQGFIVMQRIDNVSHSVAYQGFWWNAEKAINQAAFLYVRSGDACFYGKPGIRGGRSVYVSATIPCHVFMIIELKFLEAATKAKTTDITKL